MNYLLDKIRVPSFPILHYTCKGFAFTPTSMEQWHDNYIRFTLLKSRIKTQAFYPDVCITRIQSCPVHEALFAFLYCVDSQTDIFLDQKISA